MNLDITQGNYPAMVDPGGERAGQRGSIPLTNPGGQRGLSHRATFLKNPELRELLLLGCKVNGEWTSEEAWQIGELLSGHGEGLMA